MDAVIAESERHELILQIARERGGLLAAGDFDPQAVDLLDARLAQLRQREPPFSKLRTAFLMAQDGARFSALQQRVWTLGREIGKGLAFRLERSSEIAGHRRSYQSLLHRQRDLLERSQDAAPLLEELKQCAIKHGASGIMELEAAAADLFRALHFLKKDYDLAAQTIHRHRDAVVELKAVYRGRYRVELGGELGRGFRGAKLSHLTNLLNGDTIAAHSDEIYIAITTPSFRRFSVLAELLMGLPARERPAVECDFINRYGGRLNVSSLEEALRRSYAASDLEYLLALQRGAHERARAVYLKYLLSKAAFWRRKRNLSQACRLLLAVTPAEYQSLDDHFTEVAGSTLRTFIELHADLPHPVRAHLLAIIARDRREIDLTLLRCIFSGFNFRWIGDVALRGDPRYLEELVEDFEETYGQRFWQQLRRSTFSARHPFLRVILGDEYQFISALFKKGRLSEAELLANCMFGVGTDEEGIKKVLASRSPEQIAAVREQFRQLFPGRDLDALLEAELSGDDLFDVRELMHGDPGTLEELYHRVFRRFQYERSGSWVRLVKFFTRDLRREERLMIDDCQSAIVFYNDTIVGRAYTIEDAERFRLMAGRAMTSCQAFRRARNVVADFTGNVAASVWAALMILSCYALTASIAFTMLAAMIASMAARFLFKSGIKGRRAYGFEERTMDFVRAVIDGGSLLAGRLTAQAFVGKILRGAAKTGLGQLVNAGIRIKKRSLHAHASVDPPPAAYDAGAGLQYRALEFRLPAAGEAFDERLEELFKD